MPAKLQNSYLISDDVCALIVRRRSGSVTALFDIDVLPAVKRMRWTYSGEIIQSTSKVAIGKLIGGIYGMCRRKEWNDDYTKSNWVQGVVSVGTRLVLEKLRAWNNKFHKQSKLVGAEDIVSLRILLTDSSIVSVKVRNRDSYLIPLRAKFYMGKLYLLKPDDSLLTTIQRSMITKLDLPIFADYPLADPLDFTVVDTYNFNGVGMRCVVRDTTDERYMFLELYCDYKNRPLECSQYECVRVVFDVDALADILQYRWFCFEGRILANYSVFNSEGVLTNTQFQLARFLAECANLDIGPYVIPGRSTATYMRMTTAGDSKKLRGYLSKQNGRPSLLRVRSAFYTKDRSLLYRLVYYCETELIDGVYCLDMRASALTLS